MFVVQTYNFFPVSASFLFRGYSRVCVFMNSLPMIPLLPLAAGVSGFVSLPCPSFAIPHPISFLLSPVSLDPFPTGTVVTTTQATGHPPGEVGPLPPFQGPDTPSWLPDFFLFTSQWKLAPYRLFYSPNIPSWSPRSGPCPGQPILAGANLGGGAIWPSAPPPQPMYVNRCDPCAVQRPICRPACYPAAPVQICGRDLS